MRNGKMILGTMILGAALMVGGIASVGVHAAEKATSEKQSYTAFMKQSSKKVTCEYINGYDFDHATDGQWKTTNKSFKLSQFKNYKVQDLNADGSPELLMATSAKPYGEKQYVLIATMKDGKVKPVFCVAGLRSGLFSSNDGQICFGFGASDLINNVFLSLKEDKLSYVTGVTQVLEHTAKGDVYTYKKDGNICKKEDFDTQSAKKGTAVSFPSKNSRLTINFSNVKLSFPSNWSKKSVLIKAHKDYVTLISKKNKKQGGILATVFACKKSAWKEVKKNLPNQYKIGTKKNKVFYVVLPTDVQVSSNKKNMKEYNDLQITTKHIDFVH